MQCLNRGPHMVPLEKEAKANAKGATLMSNWLKRGAAQKKEGGQPPEKK